MSFAQIFLRMRGNFTDLHVSIVNFIARPYFSVFLS